MIENNKIITPTAVLDLNHVVFLQILQGNDKTAVEVRLRGGELVAFTGQAAEDIARRLSSMSSSENAPPFLSNSRQRGDAEHS